jgi:hypothetical protein
MSATQPTQPISSSNELIVIHVCDENRKVNKDFKCEKSLLMSQMKYFEKYLTGASSIDDIDISVHCDINIFDWLIKYMHKNPCEDSPKLEVNNVISILISSDFLQMSHLVGECVEFIALRISDIVRLPIDMNCLNSGLVKRIAEKVQVIVSFKIRLMSLIQ